MSRQKTQTDDIKSRDVGGEAAKKKKTSPLKVFGIIAGVLIAILVIIAAVLTILMFKGQKAALGANKEVENIVVPAEVEEEATVETDSDENTYIFYNGKKYIYNDKVTTILFAGIDQHADEQLGTFGTAGQADTIFTAALNTETGKYKLMAISRDTMTDVNILDKNGKFIGTEKQQVCLAYAYGDGKEGSCENLKRSVSRILLGVPVNSYAAIDLDAIPILNDGVGGVEVTVNEDLTRYNPSLWLGASLTLDGKQAETFVRARDIYGDENQNNLRMERQKIYLTSFIQKTLALTKQDIKTPLRLYNSVSDYMVTDIDTSMITYYTSVFLKTGFSAEENLIKLPGTTTASDKYAEYYIDSSALFDIVLDTYYTEVK